MNSMRQATTRHSESLTDVETHKRGTLVSFYASEVTAGGARLLSTAVAKMNTMDAASKPSVVDENHMG